MSVFILYVLLRFRQSFSQKAFILSFALAMFVMSLNPDWSTRIANFFGIGRGADFLFYISHLTLFFIAFLYYLKFKEMERQFTKLTRDLAIHCAREGRGELQDQASGPRTEGTGQ